MAITTSTDEAAEDGEKRVSASFDEGTEQVLTVGDEEVAADHLGAAEKAMIEDLEEDVKQLTVAEGQVVGIADEVDPVEGQDSVVGEESRWRHRLVLYDNDKELYDGAKAEGFTGKWTDELFRQLGAYAIGVLQGMLVSGEIYGLVAEIGRPVKVTPRQRDMLVMLKSEREALAFDVTAEAFVLWMRYEANGTGWNGDLGKALPSYLVDQCKQTFTAVFRDWQNARGGELAASSLGLSIEEVAEMRGVHGHGELLAGQEAAAWCDELIEGLWSRLRNTREKTIVGMLLAGRSHKEIAEDLGTTPKAVSRTWDRIKHREGSK